MEFSRAKIINHTSGAEKLCASAARISNTKYSSIELYSKSFDDDQDIVKKVLGIGHISFIEHASFNIAFENVSAFVEQFMIEFRLAAFTIKSRRYVDFGDMGYLVPAFTFKKDAKVFDDINDDLLNKYRSHMSFLFSGYRDLLADNIPKEDARFILPYSYRSNFYCTINCRELIHVIYAALHGRGRFYPEIVSIGSSLLEQGKEIFPSAFNSLGKIESGNEDKSTKLSELFNNEIPRAKNFDHGVELLSHTHRCDDLVLTSAIVTNTGCSTKDALDYISDSKENCNKIIEIISGDRRNREFEQINFTFRINNISLAGLTHLVRHRIQNIIIPSFVEAGKSSNFITPKSIASNKHLLEKYNNIWKENNIVFEYFRDAGCDDYALVYLYLSGNLLNVITTMNAREILHFIRLRSCNRAQWEIRNIAIDMLKILREISPMIFSKYGPSCYINNKCPEGKMTCGKINEVCNLFDNL